MSFELIDAAEADRRYPGTLQAALARIPALNSAIDGVRLMIAGARVRVRGSTRYVDYYAIDRIDVDASLADVNVAEPFSMWIETKTDERVN